MEKTEYPGFYKDRETGKILILFGLASGTSENSDVLGDNLLFYKGLLDDDLDLKYCTIDYFNKATVRLNQEEINNLSIQLQQESACNCGKNSSCSCKASEK